jgi:excisionase family DNA binding protein
MELLTVSEVAAMLRISKGQVYEMTKKRTRTGEVRSNPIPSLRIGSSVRFRKSDVENWIEKLAQE